MAKRGYIPTTQEVEDLFVLASSGDMEASKQLGELSNRLTKRANQRMRDLESQGLAGTAAYNNAKYWISEEYGGEYFSQSRNMRPEDLADNIEAASQFLRSQTSTSAGERKRRVNILETLENRKHDKKNPYDFFESIAGETQADQAKIKKQLLEFFDTDAWEDIRKHNKGGTNPMVAEAVEAINNGALLGDLKRAFKDFQRNTLDTDYIQLWEDWKSAEQYYRKGAWHTLKSKRK